MSLPRYPRYKDSGIAWMGRLPEHWGTSRLKNLFTLMKRAPEEGDEIVTAFRDGQVTLRSNRRVDGFTNAVHEHGYQRVRAGDLVIHAMDAFAGAIGVSDSDGKSTPVYSVCTPTHPVIYSQYYGRLLRHMALTGYINSLSKGIRERSTEFRWNEASAVVVAVPELPEQVAIASFLDHETAKIDALVAEQERLIELLKEKRQAVISHAVTKGVNPDVPMKESGIEWLGEIPKHWSTTQLKYATSIIVDCPHETPVYSVDGPYLVIRTADLDRGIIKTEGMYRVSENEYTHRIRRQALRVNDIVYGREGERWGHAGLVVQDDTFCLGQRMMQFRARAGAVIPSFLMWQLNARTVYVQGELDTVGATAPHVNVATIRNYFLSLPPPSEQGLIADYLTARASSFDTLIAEAQRAIALLQERRTALISAAVTGQIDVREAAGRAA